ncbi:restriction endonuclease subunit S [Scytonema sp. PRP1]|uniref:restriction endonuclease subunit S n=1 Tax=Scytonema sp. PRP1 TaxID=3120513 RepID=UPI002FD3BB6F
MRDVLVKTEEFKDSPLGKIPKDWNVLALFQIVKRIKRGPSLAVNTDGIGVRYLTSDNISESGEIDWTIQKYLDIEPHFLGSLLSLGDVIINCVNSAAQIGKVSFIDCLPELTTVGFNNFAISLDKNFVVPRFAFYLLSHSIFQRQISATVKPAINQVSFSSEDLISLLLPLPPICEQKSIAEILDTVDEAIARTSSLITKLKQIKAGLLHDLLTRGLDEDGQLRDAGAHPEQFKDSPLGRIPKEWEVVELKNLCNRITDGSHQSVKTSDNGVPFLYVSCVRDGQILWEQAAKIPESTYLEISKGREPIPGLILYTAVGSYGHAALVLENYKFSFQRHIAYILPNAESILPEYLVAWLNSPECRKYADQVALGNAQKTVTLSALSGFPVLLLGFDEQRRIAEIFNSHDTRIRKEEAYLNKLKLQKQGLMHDLLTGKVRVNDMK